MNGSDVVIVHDKQNRTIEYIKKLPQQVIPINSYNEKPICPGYYYSPLDDRIIKTATTKSKYPYRYNRSHTLHVKLLSGQLMTISEFDLKQHAN